MERNDNLTNNQDYNLLGKVSLFRVLRETKLGYVLESDDGDEYFLHHNECAGRYLTFNDNVKAFVYVDKMKRLACTLEKPLITVENAGFGKVVGASNSGVFISIGTSKDILFSLEHMPKALWPQVDDYLCGRLVVRAKNLCFKQLNKTEIIALNDGTKFTVDQEVEGYVYRISEDGINLVTKDYNVIFIHKSSLRKKYRLGELVNCKITKISENDYSATTIEQKEIARISDSEILLNYLNEHNGVMNYGDKTDAAIIEHVFHMSKSAFKRALGNLYHEGLVILEDKKTILKR